MHLCTTILVVWLILPLPSRTSEMMEITWACMCQVQRSAVTDGIHIFNDHDRIDYCKTIFVSMQAFFNQMRKP